MAEINEEDLQDYLDQQMGTGVEEEVQPVVTEQAQPEAFQSWDSYTSDPEYQTLGRDQKQQLYDSWRKYATDYLATSGNLLTREDIDYAQNYFNDVAETEGLRRPDYTPPGYAQQLIEQGQSGLRSFQSGIAGYGALIGVADPDEVASAIVSRNREEDQRYISPEFKEYSQKQLGFFGAAKELITNPFDLVLPFFAQSFGSNLPALGLSLTAGAAGTAVGGPAVGAVTGLYAGAAFGGATDAVVTVGQLINDEVRKRGLDPLKPEDVASVLKDPEFKERALKESTARGLAIGATGLASLGLGQILARPAAELAKLGAGAVTREGARQLAIQTVAEPVGETAAQVGAQIATGQPIEVRGREIAEETFVGLPTAAVEAGALTYSNLVKNNAPSTANEVLRESVTAFRQGEFEKILGEPTTDQSIANFYDSLTIGEKAKTLGLATNAILTQGQGSYANLSEAEKALVGQAFEGAKQATAPAVTAAEAEVKAAEEAQKALEEVPAPVVEAPAPVAEAPAPVAEAPAPAPAPTPITEAPPIAEAPKAELGTVAPATAAVVEAEAPAPVTPAPAPANLGEVDPKTIELIKSSTKDKNVQIDNKPFSFKFREQIDAPNGIFYPPEITIPNTETTIPTLKTAILKTGAKNVKVQTLKSGDLKVDWTPVATQANPNPEKLSYTYKPATTAENKKVFIGDTFAATRLDEILSQKVAPAPATPAPTAKVLPPTKKQISALEKLGYLPADIQALNRTQAKDILAKQTPKVEAPKEAPQAPAPAGVTEAPAVAPAPVVEPPRAAPAQPAVGEAGGPVAPPAGEPATQETVEQRLAKADQKLTAVLEKLGGALDPDVKLDNATVTAYFGGVPDQQTQRKVQALLRLVTLGLSNAKQRLAKAKAAGRNLDKTFTNINKIVFTRDQTGGGGIYADPRNPFEMGTLYINPDQLTRALLTDLTRDPADFFASMLEEEIIHANHGRAMVNAFVQTFPKDKNPEIYASPQATLDAFTKFYDAQNREIENSLTLDQIKRVVGRYAQSLGINMTGKTKEQIIQEFNVGRPGRLAEEYLRAFIQERQLGTITEEQVKAYATRPILRALGAIRNWFRELVGRGVEKRKTFVDKHHDAILSILIGNPQERLAAQGEINTAIPGRILASSIDPFAEEMNRLNKDNNSSLLKEIEKELGKDGEWRRSIISRLQRSFRAIDPAEVESIVYQSVPEALGGFNETLSKFPTYLTRVATRKLTRAKGKTLRRQAREVTSFQSPGFYNVPTELRQARQVQDEAEAEIEIAPDVATVESLEDKIIQKAKTLEQEIKGAERLAPIREERAIAAAYDPETGKTNVAEEGQELEELTLADGEQISSLDAEVAEKRTAYIESQLGEAGRILASAARALGLTKLETEILAYAADPKASVSTPNQVASILSRKQITDKYGLTNDQFDNMRDDVLTRMREQLGRAGVTRTADVLASSISLDRLPISATDPFVQKYQGLVNQLDDKGLSILAPETNGFNRVFEKEKAVDAIKILERGGFAVQRYLNKVIEATKGQVGDPDILVYTPEFVTPKEGELFGEWLKRLDIQNYESAFEPRTYDEEFNLIGKKPNLYAAVGLRYNPNNKQIMETIDPFATVTTPPISLASSVTLEKDPETIKQLSKQYDVLVGPKNLKKIVSNIASELVDVSKPIKDLARYIVNNPKWDWVFKSGVTDISSEIPTGGLYRTNKDKVRYENEVIGTYQAKEDAIYLNKNLIIYSFIPPSRSKFLGKPTKQQLLELENKTKRYFNNEVASTILHELIHKATARISRIYELSRLNIDIPEDKKQGVKLAELLLMQADDGKTFLQQQLEDFPEFKYLSSQYSEKELYKIFDTIENIQDLHDQVVEQASKQEKEMFDYELSSYEEFVAQAFSNPNFQAYLGRLEVEGKVTAFDRLKQFIKDLFFYISGQTNQSLQDIAEGSVLGEILQTASDLVEIQTYSPRIEGEPEPSKLIISLASSIDPTQSQALARAKTTLPKDVAAEVNAVIKDPFTDAQLERQAKDFVKANSPNGDVMHAKRILDGRPNMRFEERVATLAVIGKILRDRAFKVETDIEKSGNSPERTALRQYLNTNLKEVFSAAQELATRAGQELRAIRTANGIFLPYNWESLYTGPISDQQEQILKYKQEVIQLKAELERLRAVLARDAGNGISIQVPAGPEAEPRIRVTPRPPEAPVPEGENFYQLLSLFGDLAPVEGENFADYLTRLGVPYDDVIAALEGVKAASVSATGVARVVPANLRSLPASEAIKQLVAIDKNFFGKLVSLRLKAGGGATQAEVTAGLQRKRTNVRERPIELQTVFDFFSSTESNKPTSKAPIEEETLPPLVRLAKYAADTVTERILRSLGVDKTKPPTDADTKLERQVRALVNAQFRQETNPVQASPEDTRSVEERLQDMVQRISLAETVFNQVKTTLQEEIAFDNRARELKAENQLSPKQRADLEERAAREFNPNAINTLDSLLRKVIDFKAEARKHMTQRGATIESLQSIITQKFPNFSETQAQALAKFLGARYAKLVEDARSKQLANIVRRIGEKETAMPKSKMQQIFELINLGAFDDAAFYNAIAERYDLPEWDPAIADEIRKRADKIQRLPKDSDQQLTESFLLNAFIANEHNKQKKGFAKVGRWLDVASSLWKAGVLSGPPTQLVNLGATHLNVLMELFAEANAYRKAAKAKGLDGKFNEFLATGLAAYWDSVGRVGAEQAGDAFATGLTRFRNEKQTELTPLENFTFDTAKPWKLSNYVAAWKIVGRAMAAADTYNSVIANEAKARMAARYSMLVDGMTAEEATKRTDEIFDRNNAANKAIEEQVGQEEAQGQFGSLAGLDPNSSAYRSEKRKIEAGKRRRYAQLREQNAAREANIPDLGEIRKFTETATFNNQPQGLIGYIGGHIVGSMVGRVPILVPFAAFPRTIANIINAGLNYTPYGFARANGFSIGNAFGVVRDKGYAFAGPEKDSVEYHKLQTQALYGSIVVFTLIGLALRDMDKDWDDAFFAVTGRGPSDPEKREQLRLSGWVENSVKFGPLRFKHTDFPGLNTIFGAMALISDDWRYGKLSERDAGTILTTAALGIGNSIFDKQLLSGAKTLFEAVSDRGDASTKAKRVIQSYSGGFLNPGFARWMTKTFNIGADGMVDVTDTKELNSTVGGFLLGLTPAAVIAGKPALNRLGEPLREYPYAATMKRFGFVPEVKEHPVFTPLVRAGLFVPGASINLKINDFENGKPVQRKMDQAEFYNYSKYNGEYLRRRLTPQKAEALARLAERNQDAAQKQLEDLTRASKDYAKTRIEAEIRLNRRRK